MVESKADEEDKKAESGAPTGYQFFVDDPGNSQYSFGLNSPLPDLSVNNFASLLQQNASISQNVNVDQNVQFAPQADILESIGYNWQSANPAANAPEPAAAPAASPSKPDSPVGGATLDDEGWPTLTKRERLTSGAAQSLNLENDARFAGLSLNQELRGAVDRVYALVDLDFSGFVDFKEMASVLETEHLSVAEKKLVKIIYSVGRKVLSERPAFPAGVSPVMTLSDFRHALAFQYAQIKNNDKPLKLQAGGVSAETLTEIKASVYADIDNPLASIKPAAVRVGTMGDAYFAAVTGAITELRPRAILRIIREKPDRSFNIAFSSEPGKPLEVMQPRPEEIMRYGLVSKFGFWYPLLEKAYGIQQAKQTKLAHSSLDKRSDSLKRAAQALEAMTGRSAGTMVTANCNASQLFEYLSSFMQRQRVVVAVANDSISESSSYSGVAPLPNKPYPVVKLDLENGKVVLHSVYGATHDDEDFVPLIFTAPEFLHLFKVLYFEEDAGSGSKLNNLLKATIKQGSSSWKKIG